MTEEQQALVKRIANGESTDADSKAIEALLKFKTSFDAWQATDAGLGGPLFDAVLDTWGECK